jgi:predicted dehydrogenase
MMPLRIAVVGGGHLGRIHTRLLSSIDEVQVVAVSDPSDAARAAIAQQFGTPTYASHRQVIDLVDAAVIASPSDLHATIAQDFLNAGKHLLVEKPLTIQPYQADDLVRLAERRNLVLQVGHVERFNPAWTASSHVVRGAKYIEATRASSFPGRCLDVGVVMDLMIHDIDLVLSVTDGELVDCQASGLSLVSNHEDIAEARLTFGCGMVANLKASRISTSACRVMQTFGPHGFAEIDFSTPSATLVTPSAAIANRQLDPSHSESAKAFRDDLFEHHLQPVVAESLEPRNAILDELHDFVISIRSAAAPIVSGRAGARAVQVADRVLQSIARRQWNGPTDILARGPHVEFDSVSGRRDQRRAA